MELTDKTTYILKSFLLLLDTPGKGQDVLGFTVTVLTWSQWQQGSSESILSEEDYCSKTGDDTKNAWTTSWKRWWIFGDWWERMRFSHFQFFFFRRRKLLFHLKVISKKLIFIRPPFSLLMSKHFKILEFITEASFSIPKALR